MNLVLERNDRGNCSTMGALFVNGKFFCSTIEPPATHLAHPCIPKGTYEIHWYKSRRFDAYRLCLKGVPDRQYILIHEGNKPDDTQGCIIVGEYQKQDYLRDSRYYLFQLHQKVQLAFKRKEQVTITIR